jgi:hypothetical protein
MGDEDPYRACIQAFCSHDYDRAANDGLQLISEHMYHWLAQVMLISMQREGRTTQVEQMADFFLRAFDHEPWETALIDLTMGRASSDDVVELATDDRRRCQLAYYFGARLLTTGEIEESKKLLGIATQIEAECVERLISASELVKPEPCSSVLERLTVRAAVLADSAVPGAGPSAPEPTGDLNVVRSECEQTLSSARKIADYAGAAWTAHDNWVTDVLGAIVASLDQTAAETVMSSVDDDRTADDRPAPTRSQCNGLVLREMNASIRSILQAPIESVTVWLKHVDMTRMTDVQQAMMLAGFPLFSGRPKSMQRAGRLDDEMRDSPFGASAPSPFARRRFSGDTSHPLPRARYHAVCLDQSGDDGGTLIEELNAYALPNITGHFAARSTTDHHVIELVNHTTVAGPNWFTQLLASPSALDWYNENLPDTAPLRLLLSSDEIHDLATQAGDIVVPVDCEVREAVIDRCLDLRRLEARQWAASVFVAPPAGLMGKSIVFLAGAHSVDLGAIRGWEDALAIFMGNGLGGNPLTDMFGNLLRNIGVEALIYPSSRADNAALWDEGVLRTSRGWNLVDYRGLDSDGRVGIDIGDPIPSKDPMIEYREVAAGLQAGSYECIGVRRRNRLANQFLFEQWLASQSSASDKTDNHNHTPATVPSYLWYLSPVGAGRPREPIQCARCNSVTTFVNRFLGQCPSCGYIGET